MIGNVAREIAQHLKSGDMVVVRSTVEIGTTRNLIKPILDATGCPYDLVFCPERTLGRPCSCELRELPQIVAGHDQNARIRAAQVFQFLTPTVVQVSSSETGEMIKLVDNAQRDVLFGLSNEVARIADTIGVSVTETIRAWQTRLCTLLFANARSGGRALSRKGFGYSRKRSKEIRAFAGDHYGGAAH